MHDATATVAFGSRSSVEWRRYFGRDDIYSRPNLHGGSHHVDANLLNAVLALHLDCKRFRRLQLLEHFRYRDVEMNTTLSLLLLYVVHALSSIPAIKKNKTEGGEQDDINKVYYFKKMSAAASCAYTASWLAHINLFRRVTW